MAHTQRTDAACRFLFAAGSSHLPGDRIRPPAFPRWRRGLWVLPGALRRLAGVVDLPAEPPPFGPSARHSVVPHGGSAFHQSEFRRRTSPPHFLYGLQPVRLCACDPAVGGRSCRARSRPAPRGILGGVSTGVILALLLFLKISYFVGGAFLVAAVI